MSARYGDRTRSGDAVSQGGRRVVTGGAGGGAQSMYEETFTSPGTWTWPGNVTHVEVLLVGGGGGAGSQATAPSPAGYAGHGGGGGVRMVYDIPVSAPVPVTVGAGGAGGTFPNSNGSVGGDSAFGPLSPPIPPTTYKVGGGGGGVAGSGSFPVPTPTIVIGAPMGFADAPPDGGGGGGKGISAVVPVPPASPLSPIFPTVAISGGWGGEYGMPGRAAGNPGPSGIPNDGGQSGGALTPSGNAFAGLGKWGYGGGRKGDAFYYYGSQFFRIAQQRDAKANSGEGGLGAYSGGSTPGKAGGSGVVIVRWWE